MTTPIDAARAILRESPTISKYDAAIELLDRLKRPVNAKTMNAARAAVNRAIAKPVATRGGAREGTGPKRQNWKCKSCERVYTHAQFTYQLAEPSTCECGGTEFELVALKKKSRKE